MARIRVPEECIETYNGNHRTTTPITNSDGTVGYRLQRYLTQDVRIICEEFLTWAARSIPEAKLLAVYVSGETDAFEVHGSDDDIMLVRMKWYSGQPVPPYEEIPEFLYVTAPYDYHASQTTVPEGFNRA